MDELAKVLAEMSGVTGAHSAKECHDALEGQRELGDVITRSDDATKRILIPQWEKVPSIWLRQQMAGYDLLACVQRGDKIAALQLDEMIAACKAVML